MKDTILGNASGIIKGNFGCQIEMAKEEMSVIEQLEKEYPTIANGYKKILKEQYELFAQKMLSYGVDNISMGSDLKEEVDKKLSLTSIWIRCSDKINRLKNLLIKNKSNPISEEPITDAWVDLCNYSIIAQLVHRDQWKNNG
jgi:hypothetical protein